MGDLKPLLKTSEIQAGIKNTIQVKEQTRIQIKENRGGMGKKKIFLANVPFFLICILPF